MIWIAKLARDERGVSMIEYCFLSALVAVSLIFALNLLGAGLASSFNETVAALDGSSDDDDDEGEED